MKKFYLAAIAFIAISLLVWKLFDKKQSPAIADGGDVVRINTERTLSERMTDFLGAAMYEFNMLKDPKGVIPEGIRAQELAQADAILQRQAAFRTTAYSYAFVGPGNLGGRTRTILYDAGYNGTTNQIIYSGGVSGGFYKSLNNGATWIKKSPNSVHYSVTSIAQDTSQGNLDTLYYTTGEALGNSANGTGALYSGNGVYRSTDRGETWTRLPGSNPTPLESFSDARDYISKIVVAPNGYAYIAALNTIYRSTNGGNTWLAVLSGTLMNNGQMTDIVVRPDGRLYAGFGGTTSRTPAINLPGVWTSTSGDTASWTKIAGDGAPTNHPQWDTAGGYGRVVLALVPGKDSLYALYYNGVNNNCSSDSLIEADLFRWDLSEGAWTNLSMNLPNEPGCLSGNDPFSVQAGYDLVIAVKPDEDSVVYVGGTNIYRSKNAFADGSRTTRIGGYNSPANFNQYPNSHPDIHAIVFQPNNPAIMLCGNDGGIQRTMNDTAATVAWQQLNNDFRTFQYYYVTLNPRIGSDRYIGGAQDNGTSRNIVGSGTDFEIVLGADGASVGLSDSVGTTTLEYAAFQNGPIFRRSSAFGPNFGTAIRPDTATRNGLFVTLFHLDPDNTQNLYYANDSALFKTASASTVLRTIGTGPNAWTLLSKVGDTLGSGNGFRQITALATTRGTYNPATSSLFFGTNAGTVFRLDDPANATAESVPVNITGTGFPPTGYIRSISVNPRNDDTVLVAFTNYGIVNLWWTGNANAAQPIWKNVEGNLTLPSIRSSAIALTCDGIEYFVGTSVGLYRATIDSSNAAGTTWTQEAAFEIGNAVISSLALRISDNTLAIGTHGFGMWSATLSLPNCLTPLHLLTFEGNAEKNYNALKWTTTNEQGTSKFEIERKYIDENKFESVGTVASKNTPGNHQYSFNDVRIDLGKTKTSYRLKQVDIDGKFVYSKVINLSRTASGKFIDYVTMTANSVYIRVNNATPSENMNVNIYDGTGKLVQSRVYAYQSQVINIGNLSRGVYIVDITNRKGERFTQRVLK